MAIKYSYRYNSIRKEMITSRVPMVDWLDWCDANGIHYTFDKTLTENDFDYFICFDSESDLARFKLTWR